MSAPIFLTKTLQVLKSHSPEILTALAVSGVVSTSYLTHKAATEVARDEDADPHASNKEKILKYWKIYIPPAASGIFTVGCIIGASKATGRRTAAAVTAYSLTERAFSEYRDKVVEELGKGKEEKIRDAVAQDIVAKSPTSQVIITGKGNILCCELHTRRYFRSDMESLKRAENEINLKVVNNMYVTLDEFYDITGLEYTATSRDIGWDSSKLMVLEFSTVLSPDGEPCLAFDYNYTKPI